MLSMCSTSHGYSPSEDICSLKNLCDKGIKLGEGNSGTVYKYGKKVYKICNANPSRHDKTVSAPSRIAQIWNDIYLTLYGSKFRHFASAKMIFLEGECILETPYIEGENITEREKVRAFNHYLFSAHHRVIGDGLVSGNLKQHQGFTLPVDFDHVFDSRRNSFGSDIISKFYNINDLLYS